MLVPVGGGPSDDIMAQILGQVNGMHPRFHLPAGGDKAPPEDADIHFLGCFEERQLDKVDLKYYGESNAASFNAMYWHARGDGVPYFAMSRHGEPMGHAFTAHGLIIGEEKPKWGVYDGCGSPCVDTSTRWCGCAHEPARGFPNQDCSGEETMRRFSVYRIGSPSSSPTPEISSGDAASSSVPATIGTTIPAVENRARWLLQDNGGGIDIVVPKGMTPKVKGKQVLLYNASDPEAPEADAVAAGQIREHTENGAAPLSKMRLPAAVDEQTCVWAAEGKDSNVGDGSRVLTCQLANDSVRQVPIKVIDEL